MIRDAAYEAWKLGFLPPDLTGQSVLDIGCYDGWASVACAERGANVLAIDNGQHSWNERPCLHTFPRVRYQVPLDFMSLEGGGYDLMLFWDVWYHLPNPVSAFEKLREIVDDGRVLACGLFVPGVQPVAMLLEEGQIAGDPTNWFVPTKRLLGVLSARTGLNCKELGTRGDRLMVELRRAA